MEKLKLYIFIVFLLFFSTIPASYAGVITPELQSVLQSLAPYEEVPVIITLSDEVDLSLLKEERDKYLKRARIVKELKDKANLTQGPLKALLRIRGSKRTIPFWIMNGIAATVPAWTIREIADFPRVGEVALDEVIEAPPITLAAGAPPEWNIAALKAPDLWNIGFTGAGTVVANTDTGVDIFHPDLSGKWRGGTNSWFNPYSDPVNSARCATPNQCSTCESNSATPCDLDGHGTGTMGIMVGGSAGGTAIGVAPDAKWIGVKVLNDAGSGASSIILQGFEWILGLPPTDAPDVVNNSWGFENVNGCNTSFQSVINAMKAAGIEVVFSAGNSGVGPNIPTSVSPANNPGAFPVGATDINNAIASFSSRGPSACDGSIFPHVVAPGVSVKTSDITNGGLFQNSYATVSGTSFSSPHAAGAMALLLSAFPSLTPAELESTLKQTALDLGSPDPDNNYGYGLVDTAAAYQDAFTALKGTIPQIAALPSSFTFTATAVGTTSATTIFSIVNQGTGNLAINPSPNGISITGTNPSDFVITSDTCSGQIIGSLLNCTVTVQCSPLTVGSKSAILSVASNDLTTPTLNIAIDGFAWTSFPGAIASVSAPAVAWNSTLGQFQIAVRASNNRIFVGTAQANGIFNNDWVQLPSGTTPAAPAIAWNPTTNRVQIAHKGNATNNVFVSSFNADGTGLSPWTLIPANSLSAPAVTWNTATGKLQMVIRGTNNRITAGTVDGDGAGFSGWTQLPTGTTSAAPAITWNPTTNKVQIAHKGNATNNLFLGNMNPDGTGLSGWTRLTGTSSAAPAVAWNSATGKIEIVTKGNLTNNVFASNVNADGTGQSPWIRIPDGVSTDSPAIAISLTFATLNVFARDATGNLAEYIIGY